MSPDGRAPLVLDTSVAVKFYVPEEGHEQARELLDRWERGEPGRRMMAVRKLVKEGVG